MIPLLFDRARLDESGFSKTRLFQDLQSQPAGLVDIGARWGISEIFHLSAELLDVLGFEADPAEAAHLVETAGKSAAWAGFKILPNAIADKRGPVTLHLLRRANNSSILPVDPKWYERYSLAGFELEKKIQLDAVPLDDIVFGEVGKGSRYGELLKVDTQGAELRIFKGAERTLRERTLCIICEASFFTVYDGAPLFSELELYLRERGFSFYGFLDFQQRSTRRLDKRLTRGRERYMQADAIFFKDPADQKIPDVRSLEVLVLAATVLGFFDFALEVASLIPGGAPDVSDAIRHLAAISPEAVANDVTALAKNVAAHPELSAVYVGKMLDNLRDIHTYHEVKLPPAG